MLLTESLKGKGKGLSWGSVLREEEMDTNAVSDALFAPPVKAIYVHFRKPVKCKAATKKQTVSHQKKPGLGTTLCFLPAFCNTRVCSWNGTVQTGVLLLPLGIVSNIPPVIKFNVCLISYYFLLCFYC